METIHVHNIENEIVGEIELNEALFGVAVRPHILHDVVQMQRANRRQGTACTKTRSEVSGSSKKPWRQKGTGRARSGSRKSPIWRGGGTVFGPKPRDYGYLLPKKVRRLALKMALSARCAEKNLIVLEGFDMETIKTKEFVRVMQNLAVENGLVITTEKDDMLVKSSRNVPGFKTLPVEGLNVYDILLHRRLIILKPSIDSLEKRLLV